MGGLAERGRVNLNTKANERSHITASCLRLVSSRGSRVSGSAVARL